MMGFLLNTKIGKQDIMAKILITGATGRFGNAALRTPVQNPSIRSCGKSASRFVTARHRCVPVSEGVIEHRHLGFGT
jgi:hypothetical protein